MTLNLMYGMFAVLLLVLYGGVSSYSILKGKAYKGKRQDMNLFGYKDMLAAAQSNRGKSPQRQQRVQEQVPQEQIAARPEDSQQKRQATNPNGLPFDDEMYDNLKFTIDKITQRMKSPKVLTPSDISKLDSAIRAIIADSQGTAPPIPSIPTSTTPRQQIQQQASPPPSSPLPPTQGNILSFQPEVVRGPDRGDGLKASSPGTSWTAEQGQWSKQLKENAAAAADDVDLDEEELDVGRAASWNIPGMETMTKDEYYAAINKRVAKAKVCFSPFTTSPLHLH